MKSTSLFAAFLSVAAIFTGAVGGVGFSVSADRTVVSAGEQITVTATAVCSGKVKSISAPVVPVSESFTVVRTSQNQSSSSSIQIVNGQMTKTEEITYLFYYFIAPKSEGKFTFPALTLNVDGQSYASQPFTITVSGQAVSNPDIRVSLSLSKTRLYEGEQAVLFFEAAQKPNSSANPTNEGFSQAISAIEQAQGKNFAISRLFTDKVSREQKRINGEMYVAYRLPFSITPLAEGHFTIGPVPFEYEELRRVHNRDPFNDMFGGFFSSGVERSARNITTAPLNINVLPLPSPPSDFSGAVGSFTITASAEPLELPAGEAATLTINFKGSTRPGSMHDIKLPQMKDFEVFSPEVHTFTDTTSLGIKTRRTFKYLVIPQEEGTRRIEPIRWVYFDPSAGSYKTAETQPITFNVLKGAKSSRQQTRYLTQEEIRQVGSDIRYIKTPARIKNQQASPHRNPVFILLYPLPFLMALFSFLYKVQSEKRRTDGAKIMRARARGTAGRKLAALSRQIQSVNPAEASSKIYDTVSRYASHRFGFAAAGMTLEQLREEFKARINDPSLADKITSFLEVLDSIRFSPAATSKGDMEKHLDTARFIIFQLEKTGRRKKKSRTIKTAVVIFLFSLGSNLLAGEPVQKWFEAANAAYHSQSYDSARIYYQKIVESGVQNSAVYFNLGNACYRLNMTGQAVLYYGKAARLAPTDPDIIANMLFVEKNIVDRVPKPDRSLMDAVLWRLHNILSLNGQLWLLFGMLSAMAIMFSAGLFLSRNMRLWLIYAGSLLMVLCVVVGISAGIKIYAAEKTPVAVALEKTVDAFNQPDGNKVLFTIHEGTSFTIRSKMNDWRLIILSNGVSGWVKASAVGEI